MLMLMLMLPLVLPCVCVGVVQIYRAVLDDMSAEFRNLAKDGLVYQPAIIKPSTTTMADATQFKKVNAQGQRDNGVYAATQAQAKKQAAANTVSQQLNVANTPLMSALSADDAELPDIGTSAAVGMVDDDGVNADSACDDDTKPTDDCAEPEPMFAAAAADDDGAGLVAIDPASTTSTPESATISTGVMVGIAAGAGVLILLITGACTCVKYHRTKRNTVTSTSTATTQV